MKQVVIYPSGFAAYDVGWPILRDEPTINEGTAISRLARINARETNTISATNVVKLYMELKTMKASPSSPAMIEDAFVIFCNAFGTHNFFEWLTIQRQNPYFTREHARFLIETLEYVFTGKRYVSFGAWRLLLTHGAPKAETVDDFNFERFFIDDARNFANVQALALRWMGQPGGVDDIVSFLQLVFGENG